MKNLLMSIVLVSTILHAQPESDSEYWLSLTQEQKITFLQGIYTGITKSLQVLTEEATRQEKKDRFWSPPFVHENSIKRLNELYSEKVGQDFEWMATLVNSFYANPDNYHISIMDALQILMLHESGEISRANELLLVKQRAQLEGR
ncbi:MAG: hypothetical protein ACE5EE_05075 [Fidelibacterota bacterium]